MKPSQVAQSLRHIASKIQNSKNPDRKLVARDLKRILAILVDQSPMVKIHVTENPNLVEVEYLGQKHTAQWGDDEVLTNVVGTENLLRAAMTAWDGSEYMEISPEELQRRSGGWWSSESSG